ncbi:Peptidase_S59 [Hexamita inflata]|uniref:Nucleoporin superfamily n=1 Tax=Hexamita inflata TaxID=28002 RepID=A0AA86UMB5_9EUKA|nr:Peptidase S59 [Hexamita inflata]
MAFNFAKPSGPLPQTNIGAPPPAGGAQPPAGAGFGAGNAGFNNAFKPAGTNTGVGAGTSTFGTASGFGGGFGAKPSMGTYATAAKPLLPTTSPFETLLNSMKAKFSNEPIPAPTSTMGGGFGGGFGAKPAAPTQTTTTELKADFDALLTQNTSSFHPLNINFNVKTKINSTHIHSVPDFSALNSVQNEWKLFNQNGEIIFDEPINVLQLQKELQESTQSLNLDEVVKIEAGQLLIDKNKCPELNKQCLVKMFNVQATENMKEFTERCGFQFGCYFEEEGLWVFRMPKV